VATPFLHTLRSLKGDGFGASLVCLFLAGLLLAGWSAWFLMAPVSRYEVTEQARLEADMAAHLIQAPVSGQILKSHLLLDASVEAGQVLVELDAAREQLQLREEQARVNSLAPQMAELRNEAAAAEQAREREQDAGGAAVEESRARLEEAESMARQADRDAARLVQLHREGLIPQREIEQGQAEAERRRAAAASLRLVINRIEREHRTRDSERQAGLRRIEGEIQRLEGLKTTALASIERLRFEIERRVIRAPVSGRLGEVATLRSGGFLEEGSKLGAIIPSGSLRLIAEFAPPAALGRIRPGQPAKLRLHGFPWAQYGTISATVSSVASEIRDGRVRVELVAAPQAASLIPMQHGLPGTVEVEVDRLTPFEIALRAAGQRLAAPSGVPAE